jgi:hypothetical protein
MQRNVCALTLAALAGVLAFAPVALGDTPSFFQQWAYPWGPWTPDTPHVWGAYPPYQNRFSEFDTPGATWRELQRRGIVEVQLPDERGLLYVNGNPTPLHGRVQVLRTEFLPRCGAQVFELRAAFRSGDELLIENRTLVIRAGERTSVTFDGHQAMRVKLPLAGEELPSPRTLPDTARPNAK